MNWTNRLSQLALVALLLVSCTTSTNPSLYPNPSAATSTFTVTPAKIDSELDIQAIQKIEGEDSQIKYADRADFSLPYLSDVSLSTYETDSRYYTLDDQTHQIIAIEPKNMPSGSEGLSMQELEKLAREMIALASPEINLDTLTPKHGSKIGTYFFHWEDRTRSFVEGDRSYPCAQVGLTGKGELLNYINTLPMSR